jgi:threonine dehydratase
MAATRGYGATLDLESANPMEAFERVAALQQETGRVFVDPHSDPLVIAGHGTAGLEIEEDAPDFDAVVVGVGGGGLVSGLVAALPGRRVIAVEPELAQSLHAGIAAGARVATGAASIADGCNSPFAGALAIEMTRDLELVLVTEEEIEHAFRFLYQRAKLAVEPAGAVATAAWLAGKIEAKKPVLMVSGGNVAAQTAAAILARQ